MKLVFSAMCVVALVACGESRQDGGGERSLPNAETAAQAQTRINAENDLFFVGESRDSSWAAHREGQLATELGQLDGARLTTNECKAKLCRLTFNFWTAEGGATLRSRLTQPVGSDLYAGGVTSMLIVGPDGRTATLWLSRPGFVFPGVSQDPKRVP